jgi:hypothetical protein
MGRKKSDVEKPLTKNQWQALLQIYHGKGRKVGRYQVQVLESGGYILNGQVTDKGKHFLSSEGLLRRKRVTIKRRNHRVGLNGRFM